MKALLIYEVAGFIGSLLTYQFVQNVPQYKILNPNSFYYRWNLSNLEDYENQPNYCFVNDDFISTYWPLTYNHAPAIDVIFCFSFSGAIYNNNNIVAAVGYNNCRNTFLC